MGNGIQMGILVTEVSTSEEDHCRLKVLVQEEINRPLRLAYSSDFSSAGGVVG